MKFSQRRILFVLAGIVMGILFIFFGVFPLIGGEEEGGGGDRAEEKSFIEI